MWQVFHDRGDELARLGEHWASRRAELLVVVGRRRVGKSRLLEEFLRERPGLHLTGTLERARLQLADISHELARVTRDPLLERQQLTSWDAVLAYLTEQGRTRRVGVVLDEFAYYCDASPELPSLLQRWWDRQGQRTQLMLVLAGSHVAFMENLVLGGQALYGRRTGELHVQPFDYADAARFVPDWGAIDKLRTYAIFGGMPAYLSALDPTRSLAENVQRLVLRDDAYLRREPQYLLAQERSVERPMAYLSLLRAIAAGHTQPGQIATAAGFHSANDIAPLLARLREFRLIARLTPITGEETSRLSRYVVRDPFLAFWFRFVQPSEAALERGLAEWIWEHRVNPELDQFVSRAQGPWEQACQDYLWRLRRAGAPGWPAFDQLGPWWAGRGTEGNAELDIVGLDGQRPVLVGSCKWRNEYMKLGDLHELQAAAARLGTPSPLQYVLFSRSGFDPALRSYASATDDVHLITPDHMYEVANV